MVIEDEGSGIEKGDSCRALAQGMDLCAGMKQGRCKALSHLWDDTEYVIKSPQLHVRLNSSRLKKKVNLNFSKDKGTLDYICQVTHSVINMLYAIPEKVLRLISS